MSADVLSAEKADRMNRALDEQKRRVDDLQLQSLRPALEVPRPTKPSGRASARFRRLCSKGRRQPFDRIEHKALSAGSSPDGGYLVPEETEP